MNYIKNYLFQNFGNDIFSKQTYQIWLVLAKLIITTILCGFFMYVLWFFSVWGQIKMK